MNKAFVKEPDQGEPRCPAPSGCGGLGMPVTRKTLVSQLSGSELEDFGESCFYCPNPSCAVAYFDSWGTTASRVDLRKQVYPKSPTAPVCACFGVTVDEIREAAESGRKDLIRDIIARAESTDARCETESPSGASCAAEVRKIFMRHFNAE